MAEKLTKWDIAGRDNPPRGPWAGATPTPMYGLAEDRVPPLETRKNAAERKQPKRKSRTR